MWLLIISIYAMVTLVPFLQHDEREPLNTPVLVAHLTAIILLSAITIPVRTPETTKRRFRLKSLCGSALKGCNAEHR